MTNFEITAKDIFGSTDLIHRSWNERYGSAVLDIARLVAGLKPGERVLIERVDEDTNDAIFMAHLKYFPEDAICPTCGSKERHPEPNFCSNIWHHEEDEDV